jgi:hypothetical protein
VPLHYGRIAGCGTPLLLFLDANASCDLSTLISVKGPGRTVACVDARASLRLRGRRGRCAPLPVAVHSLSRRTAGRCTHLALRDAQATARSAARASCDEPRKVAYRVGCQWIAHQPELCTVLNFF